jgi:hypothetical protein
MEQGMFSFITVDSSGKEDSGSNRDRIIKMSEISARIISLEQFRAMLSDEGFRLFAAEIPDSVDQELNVDVFYLNMISSGYGTLVSSLMHISSRDQIAVSNFVAEIDDGKRFRFVTYGGKTPGEYTYSGWIHEEDIGDTIMITEEP